MKGQNTQNIVIVAPTILYYCEKYPLFVIRLMRLLWKLQRKVIQLHGIIKIKTTTGERNASFNII